MSNDTRCYQTFSDGRVLIAQSYTLDMAHYRGALYLLSYGFGGSYTITDVGRTRIGSRHYRILDNSIPSRIENIATRVWFRRCRRVREEILIKARGTLA